MRKESALPVRLDTELKESLSRIAESTGLSVSALVRMLVKSFVDEYDRNRGRVVIPPQWKAYRDTSGGNGGSLRRVAESCASYSG